MPKPNHVATPVFGFETPELGGEAGVPEDLLLVITQIENVLKALEPKFFKTAGVGDAKKLLVVDATGAPAFKAMSGDTTISAEGVISIGGEKVLTAMLANLAVTAAKLAGESVETAKIKALAVTTAKVAEEAIETGKITNLAVTLAKLSAEVQNMIVAAGGYAQHFWSGVELTRENAAFGAFSTPILCTIPKVKPHQGVMLNLMAYVLGTGAPTLRLMIGGVSIASEITLANEAKYFPIFFEAQGKLAVGTGLAEGEIGAAVALLENQYNVPTSSLNHAPLLTKAPGAEGTNVAVELQAKIAAGKVKARGTWMNASPMG